MNGKSLYQAITATAPLHAAPETGAETVSEALFGETLACLEDHGKWIKARTQRDSYEGYVSKEQLRELIHEPAHQVKALHSFLYAGPDYKKPPLTVLPFLARLSLKEEAPQNGFVPLKEGGWIWSGHVEPATQTHTDYVTTALRFIGTPYLWGGRSAKGVDCSGLVQLALFAAGLPCPRDTKDQIALGTPVEETTPPSRGDLVFFERHVGIMIDDSHILNATARTMDTRIEVLDEMSACYKGGILTRRKP